MRLQIFLFTLFSPILAVDRSTADRSRPQDGDAPITIVAFGDSLTAGYGVKFNESFPAQLQMALPAKGHKVEIVNAGCLG